MFHSAFIKGGLLVVEVVEYGEKGGACYLLEQKADLEETGRVPEVVLGGILVARKDPDNFSFKLVSTKIW